MTKKENNKKMHSSNGNIKNHNMKIMSWNTGSSWAENIIDYISHLLATEKPAILAIQELELRQSTELRLMTVPGYNLELDQMYQNLGMARACLYIKQNIKYTRNKELEQPDLPVIWITVHPYRQKKFNYKTGTDNGSK